MSQLKGSQRKWLRGRAHALEPIVHVGQQGLTDALVGQVDAALDAHELIKVKLQAPEDRNALAEELASRTRSELAGLVGHVVILYRPDAEKPRIVLPA